MHVRPFGLLGLAGIGAVLMGNAPSPAASLSSLAQHVTGFQLANGMKFAVMERREAPLVAIHMVVRAGTLDEPGGQAGIARMFPRMFGHGGELGTRNPAGEKAALVRVEQAYDAWKKLEGQKPPADSYDVSKARVDFQMATESAALYSTSGFSFKVLEEAGAMSVEARVDADASHYSATLPAQSAEVWFKLVADWLRRPPARRFYAERTAWVEELGRAAQSSQQTLAEDALLAAAFGTSGYGRKAGAATEAANLRAADFEVFWRKHYGPSNVVISIAGDLAPGEAKRLAELYFGSLPRGEAPEDKTATPLAFEEDRIATAATVPGSVPPVVIAWPRPPRTDPDDAVFDVIWGLLTAGQEALLPKTFEAEKVPALATIVPNFPGGRAWSLFAISAFPAGPVTREAVEAAVAKAAAGLRDKPVDDAALARVKRLLRTQLTSEGESITGACHWIARFLESGGSVDAIAQAADRIDKVTPADIDRVAKKYLRDKGRVILRPSSDGTGGGL